jgi:hypothetical protein
MHFNFPFILSVVLIEMQQNVTKHTAAALQREDAPFTSSQRENKNKKTFLFI